MHEPEMAVSNCLPATQKVLSVNSKSLQNFYSAARGMATTSLQPSRISEPVLARTPLHSSSLQRTDR